MIRQRSEAVMAELESEVEKKVDALKRKASTAKAGN
jgi:hypothetical protein